LLTIPVWIHPGSNAAPPNNVSVSGLDATSLQSVPISATLPTQDQALVYNAGAGQWEPASLTTATGDLITGDFAGNPTLLRAGSLGQILTVGPSGVLQWSNAPASGVSQIIPGNGITITPPGGTGIVNVKASQIESQISLAGNITLVSGDNFILPFSLGSGSYLGITTAAVQHGTSFGSVETGLTTSSSTYAPPAGASIGGYINLSNGNNLNTVFQITGYNFFTLSALTNLWQIVVTTIPNWVMIRTGINFVSGIIIVQFG
jgi:hypothetical protein